MTLANQPAADHRAAIEQRSQVLAVAVLQVFMRADYQAAPAGPKAQFLAAAQDLEAALAALAAAGDALGVSQQGGGACRTVPDP